MLQRQKAQWLQLERHLAAEEHNALEGVVSEADAERQAAVEAAAGALATQLQGEGCAGRGGGGGGGGGGVGGGGDTKNSMLLNNRRTVVRYDCVALPVPDEADNSAVCYETSPRALRVQCTIYSHLPVNRRESRC